MYFTLRVVPRGRRLGGTLVAALLAGCAGLPPQPQDPEAAACLEAFRAEDRRLSGAGPAGVPSRPARIPGFPHLRVDRFLASYRQEALAPDERLAWVSRMARLDAEARRIQRTLRESGPGTPATASAPGSDPLAACRRRLVRHDAGDPRRFDALRGSARVGSEYRLLARIAGLYPLAAAPVAAGIERYRREVRSTFDQPLSELPVAGRLVRFVPPPEPPEPGATPHPGRLAEDALGAPRPTAGQLAALYQHHAPVWEIDVAAAHDRPGAPRFGAEHRPGVDTGRPIVFRYPSWTRWAGRALLQLNYVVWFDRRPPEGSVNLLGGALDGLQWRVTLAPDGEVLLYDSIHPCGCYHYLFPTAPLALRPEALALPEPPLVPQEAPRLAPGERVILRVEAGSHYLQRVYADRAGPGTAYGWAPYATLYAVPGPEGATRSLFAANGLVPGSERPERWLLWPTGVPSPGAMRERGRQAVAFLGQRHFDDAHLLDALFSPRP